jgi:hypothetical protein
VIQEPIPSPTCPFPGPSVYFGSGRRIDAYHFDADDLPPPLIGRALSRLNRFGGAGERPVNVAQHSYNLSFVVGDCPHRQRAALMHDVPEMWTGEIPRPIKRLCPGIEAADACMIARLSTVYGIPLWAFDAIKDADSRISFDERLFMFDHMDPADREVAEQEKLGIHIVPVTPEISGVAWTRRFYQLFREDLS